MPIPRQGPVDFEAVRAELGESEADDVALCTSAKINRKAKYKPYRIDTFRDITDTDRTGMHVQLTAAEGGGTVKAPYGLVPRGFAANGGFGAMTMLPWLDKWANDCKPRAGVDWCRITDFAGYNQKAGSFIHDVKLYTNNPKNPSVPMGPATASEPVGYIYADITVSPMEGGITLADFSSIESMSGLRYTLLFGHSEGNDPFDSTVYAAQAEVSASYSGLVKLRIDVTQSVRNQIIGAAGGNDAWNVAMVCLAPPLTLKSGTQEVTGSIDFSKLVSLDMWGDGFVSVLYNTDVARSSQPAVSAHRHVLAEASPLDFYMSSPVYNSSHRTVTAEMTSQLPEITILESGADYELSTVEIRVAVRMGSHQFMSPLLSRTCSRKVSGSKVTLDYDRDPPEAVSFNVPTSVPAGTYATKVALLVMASGVHYTNGTATACDIHNDDQDALSEPWYEDGSGTFPDYAIFTFTKSLGNITIS